jgi:hypothetical protein
MTIFRFESQLDRLGSLCYDVDTPASSFLAPQALVGLELSRDCRSFLAPAFCLRRPNMYDEAVASAGGVASDTIVEKPKSRAQKVADWKSANETKYKEAREACCTCTPTRAQMLMVDQYEGDDRYIPID